MEFPTYRERQDFDLGGLRQKRGFDGNCMWFLDTNGKLTLREDHNARAEHLAVEKFDQQHFVVAPEEYEFELEETDAAYQLKAIKLGMQDKPYGVGVFLVDKTSFLVTRRETIEGGFKKITTYSDFRECDGVVLPFETSIDDTTNPIRVYFDAIRINPELDERQFMTPQDQALDFRFASGAASALIPFELSGYHIKTTVHINDKPYEFIVDTGASRTLIAKDLSEQLLLEDQGSMNVLGVSGAQEMSFVQVPELRVGDAILINQTIASVDFSALRKTWPKLAGLIGMDFLNRFVVKFDYVRKELEVFDRSAFTYAGSGKPLKLQGIRVPMMIGDREGHFTVDTGSGKVSLHTDFARRHGFLENKELLPHKSRIAGLGDAKPTTYAAKCRSLTIGGYTFHNVPIGLADTDTGSFANVTAAGNVGGIIWHRFITWFDFSENVLYLEPNSNFDEPFKYDNCGMGIEKINNNVYVEHVTTRTPAQEAGIHKGDQLLAINGRDVATYDLDEILELFCAAEGTCYGMQLRNQSGAVKDVSVTLRDYRDYYAA